MRVRQKRTKILPEIMKNQSKFFMVQSLDVSNSFLAAAGLIRVRRIKRKTMRAETKKTGGASQAPIF